MSVKTPCVPYYYAWCCRMVYTEATLNETFRLRASQPLALPHKSRRDTILMVSFLCFPRSTLAHIILGVCAYCFTSAFPQQPSVHLSDLWPTDSRAHLNFSTIEHTSVPPWWCQPPLALPSPPGTSSHIDHTPEPPTTPSSTLLSHVITGSSVFKALIHQSFAVTASLDLLYCPPQTLWPPSTHLNPPIAQPWHSNTGWSDSTQ